MTNNSQKQRIIKRLLDTGKISRNECLRNYISRLGSIINKLKKEGWDFRPEKEDGDYVYYLARSPFKKEILTVGDKKIIRYKK